LNLPFPPFIKEGGVGFKPPQSPFTKGGIEGESRRNVEYYTTIFLFSYRFILTSPFARWKIWVYQEEMRGSIKKITK